MIDVPLVQVCRMTCPHIMSSEVQPPANEAQPSSIETVVNINLLAPTEKMFLANKFMTDSVEYELMYVSGHNLDIITTMIHHGILPSCNYQTTIMEVDGHQTQWKHSCSKDSTTLFIHKPKQLLWL